VRKRELPQRTRRNTEGRGQRRREDDENQHGGTEAREVHREEIERMRKAQGKGWFLKNQGRIVAWRLEDRRPDAVAYCADTAPRRRKVWIS
jgi:hypothetical protein